MKNSKLIGEFQEYLLAIYQSENTFQAYLSDVKQYLSFIEMSGVELFDVQQDMAKQYLYVLFQKDYSTVTICRKLSSIRTFYDFLIFRKYLEYSVFAFIKFPKNNKQLPSFLYEQEIDLLIDSIDTNDDFGKRDIALFELLFASGIRVAELCAIKVTDIDFSLNSVKVIGKGNRERMVFFNNRTSKALSQYLIEVRPFFQTKSFTLTDILFLNHRGEPLTTRGVRYLLDKRTFQSPITQKLHPHMLRHSFATMMLDNGANIRLIQELLGHSSLSSTQIYTHLSKEKLKQELNANHPLAKKVL